MNWALGFLVSGAIAAAAWQRGSLSPSGAAAALVVGSCIWAAGGPAWFAVLVAFFATSTALGRVGARAKEGTKREFSKGDRRDAAQVLANGGVATAAALAQLMWPGWSGWSLLFLGALATANGDTWATELGILSRREPWSLVQFKRVPRGTSGAVSPLGLFATVAGGALIGLVAALGGSRFSLVLVGAAAGTLGSLFDSLLGATAQSGFYCSACARETESERHHCGATASRTRGLPYFGNDAVNLCATLAGALTAALVGVAIGHLG